MISPLCPGVFYLRRLLLNNNPLGHLPGSVITQPFLPHLEELNLSHCDLEELDPNSVDDFGELEILDLSFNKLKSIDGKTFKVCDRGHACRYTTNNPSLHFSSRNHHAEADFSFTALNLAMVTKSPLTFSEITSTIV